MILSKTWWVRFRGVNRGIRVMFTGATRGIRSPPPLSPDAHMIIIAVSLLFSFRKRQCNTTKTNIYILSYCEFLKCLLEGICFIAFQQCTTPCKMMATLQQRKQMSHTRSTVQIAGVPTRPVFFWVNLGEVQMFDPSLCLLYSMKGALKLLAGTYILPLYL